MIFTSILFKTS